MSNYLSGKRVIVTGASGTIGKELVHQLLTFYSVGELIGLDNNESDLFFLEERHQQFGNSKFYLADIRDVDKMTKIMHGVDIVFHTAAYKHVILCERSPFEAVQTNILGIQNVITAAIENGVKRVVFTSSDKAVNPTNVMGTSKLMGERLITAANTHRWNKGQRFVSTRFGNVLGSRGSVIPIFYEQIKLGKSVTLTDANMTRFIMSISQAVRLVIDSVELACGGEVFVTKMPVIRIKDLAEVMIKNLAPFFGRNPEDVEIKIIGSKPGEKIYEELMNDEETRRTWELPNYFTVLPAFKGIYRNVDYNFPNIISHNINLPYRSDQQTYLSQEELELFLINNNLLNGPEVPEHPSGRFWPDNA